MTDGPLTAWSTSAWRSTCTSGKLSEEALPAWAYNIWHEALANARRVLGVDGDES